MQLSFPRDLHASCYTTWVFRPGQRIYASHTQIGTLLYARPTEQDLQIRGEPLWLETKHIQYTEAHASTPV